MTPRCAPVSPARTTSAWWAARHGNNTPGPQVVANYFVDTNVRSKVTDMSPRRLVILAHLLSIAACSPIPINDAVSPTPIVSTTAASIRLTVSSRADQHLDVAAEVLTLSGKPVAGQAVTFTASLGTISPSTVTTDAEGFARTIASVPWANTLTASAAGLSETLKLTGALPPLTAAVSAGDAYEDDEVQFVATIPECACTPRVVGWDFGDGDRLAANTLAARHTYHSDGSYTVALTLADDLGRSATATQRVIIRPRLSTVPGPAPVPYVPVLELGGTCSNVTPLTVSCPVTLTYNGQSVAGRIDSVTWTWGDSTSTTRTPTPPATTVSNLTAEHVYAARGSYSITVDVHLTTGETATRTFTYTF